jgi:drug/metabolite transporter (DMT)-like permease
MLVEETVWPANAREWGAILLLGLGPVGAAFYAWDHGVKHGDLRVLGAVSYLAPVLSTVFLVIAGFATASISLALAAAFITAGGVLAAKDMFLRQSE